jgi:hypothetical protein
MLLRRMMFLAALLLLTSFVANALVANQREDDRATAPEPSAAPPAGGLRQVEARMPGTRSVRARVGDLVSLTITTEEPTDLSIDALGLSASASPQVPAVLEFVASDEGRYPVRVEQTGAELGVLVVGPR